MRTGRYASLAALVAVALLIVPSPAAADTEFKVQFVCNDRGSVYPIVNATIDFMRTDPDADRPWVTEKHMFRGRTDSDGRISLTVTGEDEYNFHYVLNLWNDDIRLRDYWSQYAWSTRTFTHQNDVPVQDFGTQVLGDGKTAPECAVFEGVRRAHIDYMDVMGGQRPPGGYPAGHRDVIANAVSWSGGVTTSDGVISWPSYYPVGPEPGTFTSTFREFAETVYYGHVGIASGSTNDQHDKPCRRYTHADGAKVAFVEGWGEYWASAYAPAPKCPDIPSTDYRVPGNVAAALASLDQFCPDVGRRQMVEVLARNKRAIHSFEDFQRALGCSGITEVITSQFHSGEGGGSGLRALFAKRQLLALRKQETSLKTVLRKSVARSREAPCPPKPCDLALERVVTPFLIRAELGQVSLLRKALAPTASSSGLRKLGGTNERRLQSSLLSRGRAFRRASAKQAFVQLDLAIAAAGAILKRDTSDSIKTLAAQLRAMRGTFRAGRLPATFELGSPAGTKLVTGPPWEPAPVGPDSPPGPSDPGPNDPPPNPPPAGPAPDLVVDSVSGSCIGAEGCLTKAVVRNGGTAAAPASKTALAQNDQYQNETLVDTPALQPGQSVTVTAPCTYGTLSFSARADATNVVGEIDETNNRRARTGDPAVGSGCKYN